MHVTGYWLPKPDDGWRPPSNLVSLLNQGPALSIGFGSMHGGVLNKVLDTALELLFNTGRRAVIMAGWSGYTGKRAQGSGFLFTDSVPHRWLFPRVTAAIHHGGAGTTAAALHAGIPSVIVPFFFDQHFWANCLHRRGLGPQPIASSRFSAGALARSLRETASNQPMLQRLSEMSERLGAEDGVGAAVKIITGALEKRVDDAKHPRGRGLRWPVRG